MANMELCSADIGETTAVSSRSEKVRARRYVRDIAQGTEDEQMLLEMLGLNRGSRKGAVYSLGPVAQAS